MILKGGYGSIVSLKAQGHGKALYTLVSGHKYVSNLSNPDAPNVPRLCEN